MYIRPLTCARCRASNPRAAVRCLDCGSDLRSGEGSWDPEYAVANRLSFARSVAQENLPAVHLSTRHFAKLERLARIALSPADPVRTFLLDELDRALVLKPSEVGDDIVEIGDCVEYRSVDGILTEQRRLVYPDELHSDDAISVLTPVGVALLGIREGGTMPYRMPGGSRAGVRVLRVAASSPQDRSTGDVGTKGLVRAAAGRQEPQTRSGRVLPEREPVAVR